MLSIRQNTPSDDCAALFQSILFNIFPALQHFFFIKNKISTRAFWKRINFAIELALRS